MGDKGQQDPYYWAKRAEHYNSDSMKSIKRISEVDWSDMIAKMVNYDKFRELYDKNMKSRVEMPKKSPKSTGSHMGKVIGGYNNHRNRATLADPAPIDSSPNPNKIFARKKATEWGRNISEERKRIRSIVDSIPYSDEDIEEDDDRYTE